MLKTHVINYAKTREVYAAYRKVGYSKAFLEAHREEIALHKAAKAAFDEAGLQKLPRVKELDAEFAELLTKKKAAYPEYRKARNEMQELVRAQKNVERFLRRKRTPPRKTGLAKRIPPRSFPSWEAFSAVFFSLYGSFAEQCACYPYIFPTIFPRAAAGRSLHKRLRNLYCAPAT